MLKGWFGDLKDGKHTGDWDDPRVAVIQVVPAEIRYVRDFNVFLYHHLTLLTSVWTQWIKTESSLAQTYELVKGAVTGETASPGALRVITESEVSFFKADRMTADGMCSLHSRGSWTRRRFKASQGHSSLRNCIMVGYDLRKFLFDRDHRYSPQGLLPPPIEIGRAHV